MSEDATPVGWIHAPIDSLISHDGVFIDGDWVESKDQDPNGEVRLIQLADIGDGVFHNKSSRFLTRTKAGQLRCTFLKQGDVLVARMPDPLGRACVFPLEGDEKFVTVVDVCIIRTSPEIASSDFLKWAINFLGTRKQIEDLQTGTTRKRISRKNLATVTIPLPPLAEQKRIVAKIEELFSELDAGEESLRRARRQLGVYRQSLLKQAFEGKLTAPWRLSARKRAQAGAQIGDVVPEARDGQWFAYIIECDSDSFYVGSTHDLRERWRRHCEGTGADWTKANPPRYLVHFETFASEAEARKRESDLKTGFGRTWRKREVKAGRIKPLVHNANNPATEPVRGEALQTGDQLLARIQSERQARYQQQLKEWEKAGGGRGKPKSPERIAPLADLKLALPRELPTGWTWIAVADVGRIETGTTPPTKEPKNYGGDTPFFKPTDLDQGVNVREAREHLSALGREAARILPAGTTLVTCIGATIGKTGLASVECATNQQINTISPEACFDSRFVYYATIAPNLNGLIKSEASATTLPILNKSKFEALPFPLCSLPEQQEIVRLLDGQFEVIEQNEREIDAALKRSEALRQSILKKAFTGQLVPQDPTDEPASALLVRIREEREASISSVRMRAR